jgi:hypothetical protein
LFLKEHYQTALLMTGIKQSSRVYFNYFTIIHFVMLICQIGFVVITLCFITSEPMFIPDHETNRLISWGIPLLFVFCYTCCTLLFRNRLITIKNKSRFDSKLSGYFYLFILRDVFLTIPSFTAITTVLMTNYYLYFVYASLSILIMTFLWPTKKKIIRDMDLNFDESAIVNNHNSRI